MQGPKTAVYCVGQNHASINRVSAHAHACRDPKSGRLPFPSLMYGHKRPERLLSQATYR